MKGYFSGTAHTSAGDLADVAALIPQNDGIHADASKFIFDDIDFLFLPLQIVRISADEGCLAEPKNPVIRSTLTIISILLFLLRRCRYLFEIARRVADDFFK